MKAMLKILATRTHLETTAEEATYENLPSQAMTREFLQADEANLLEEEDMHLFGSTPMSDPLHLVSCNGCKRPITASQYAAHAERCWALNQLKGTIMELNVGNKKSRKGRKKLHAPHDHQVSRTAAENKSEYMHGDGINGSVSNLVESSGSMCTLSREVKRIISNVPTPLATKLYYIGRNYRLRAALNRLYGQSEVRDLRNNSSLKVMQDTVHALSHGYSSKTPDQSSSQDSEFFIGGGAYMSDVTSKRNSRG